MTEDDKKHMEEYLSAHKSDCCPDTQANAYMACHDHMRKECEMHPDAKWGECPNCEFNEGFFSRDESIKARDEENYRLIEMLKEGEKNKQMLGELFDEVMRRKKDSDVENHRLTELLGECEEV